jgi:hypothetical protein
MLKSLRFEPTDHGRQAMRGVAVASTLAEHGAVNNSTHVSTPSPVSPHATRSNPTKPRATQSTPPRIRREVMRRARGCCEVPGCTNDLFIDAHHCDLRSEDGRHDPKQCCERRSLC